MAILEIILKIVLAVFGPVTEGLKTLLSNPISLLIVVLLGLLLYGVVNWGNIENITGTIAALCKK